MYGLFSILLCGSAVQSAPPPGWELVGVQDGIEVDRKTVEGSSLFAFRGEADVDVDIALLSTVLLDDEIGPEWVDLMYLSELIEQESDTVKVVRQGYDMPWPVQDRDFSMRETATYNPETLEFTLEFQSLVHRGIPVDDCCVRAMAYRTFWHLKSNPGTGKTHVIVEVNTDPKGSLPAWLVNLIQQDWPYNTITSLVKRANQGDVKEDPKMEAW
jgi:hypothetical protein